MTQIDADKGGWCLRCKGAKTRCPGTEVGVGRHLCINEGEHFTFALITFRIV